MSLFIPWEISDAIKTHYIVPYVITVDQCFRNQIMYLKLYIHSNTGNMLSLRNVLEFSVIQACQNLNTELFRLGYTTKLYTASSFQTIGDQRCTDINTI